MSEMLIEVEGGKRKRLKTANKICKDDILISGLGNSHNPMEYAYTLPQVYKYVSFSKNYELTMDCPRIKDLWQMLHSASGLRKLTLKGNIVKQTITMSEFATNARDLEEVDFSEFNLVVDTVRNAFGGCNKLRSIIGEFDFSKATDVSGFQNCPLLEEIRLKPDSLSLSISFAASSALSTESVDSIIDGLMDMTGKETRVLTFYPDIRSTLENDPVRLAKINDKNWDLA